MDNATALPTSPQAPPQQQTRTSINHENCYPCRRSDLLPMFPVAQATQRAADLTSRLLSFSRRQPLKPQAIDVGDLCTGMTDLLHRTLGETIEIDVRRLDFLSGFADPGQLENALLNLAPQRPRRDARRRQADDRNRMPDAGRSRHGGTPGIPTGRLRGVAGRRHRNGDGAGCPSECLRAVFHDQRSPCRQRARPLHGGRLRAAIRR